MIVALVALPLANLPGIVARYVERIHVMYAGRVVEIGDITVEIQSLPPRASLRPCWMWPT